MMKTTPKGLMLAPGDGRVIAGGGLQATLKVAGGEGAALTSTFEIVVPPGFDVGAHVHSKGEELFYVVEGELDLLAFEPVARSSDWHDWTSPSGYQLLRGGPGSVLFVPAGCPHAFSNSTAAPAKMLFQSAPSGHEHYFDELVALLQSSAGSPDPAEVAALRSRYDIEQLTGLRDRSR